MISADSGMSGWGGQRRMTWLAKIDGVLDKNPVSWERETEMLQWGEMCDMAPTEGEVRG